MPLAKGCHGDLSQVIIGFEADIEQAVTGRNNA